MIPRLRPPVQRTAEEFVERLSILFGKGGYRWEAVLWAGDVAIKNACDPTATTLEWRHELKAIGDTLNPTKARE